MTIDAAPGHTSGHTLGSPLLPALDHFLLGGAADHVALMDGEDTLTYAELRAAVEARAAQLDGPGPLLLEMANDLLSVVTYLAALARHLPVVLLEPGAAATGRNVEIVRRYGHQAGPGIDPHPDLALLLSTSGSTGSPKLVRLSRTNVRSNAEAIGDYLDLRSTDRGITTLPLHYCYGLSVLHSHLVAGAAVVLTDLSVADECFWELAAHAGVTGFGGVPYTFDLLTSSGFADRDLPHLRYVTQAGGRLAPDRVREVAELGQSRGFDLYVMYGQTEATARMAYLPPSLARTRPEAIGIAIPGGTLRIEDPDADGVGELVYAGPNVMMGYAVSPADLARGDERTELHTGDLAREAPDGLLEIVGRRDRVAKVFGLRIDLDRLERSVADLDPAVRLVADGDRLHAFVTRPRRRQQICQQIRQQICRSAGLPAGAVQAHQIAALPRTAAGKVDDRALLSQVLATTAALEPEPSDGAVDAADPAEIRNLYAVLLGRPDASLDDTFVTLGGDSLSYVELSTRLGSRLGRLPRDWPTRSVSELADKGVSTGRSHRWSAPLEVGVLLRTLAILIVVVTHVDLVLIPGGAHLLLAVAGYHLARFALPTPGRRARTRRILAGVAAVAVPSSLWIAGSALVTGDYHWRTAVYLNGVSHLGEDHQRWTLDWQFWFMEAIVWGFLAVALLLAIPAVDRWQRRAPFAVAAVVVGLATALRYASVGVEGEGVERYAVPSVLFVLALGWAAAEARSTWQRVAVLVASYAGLYGYFDDRQRELIVVGAVGLLLWLRPVAVPLVLAHPIRQIAAASLWIYLTHWQVYPPIEAAGHPVLALLASVAVGVAAHHTYQRGLSLRKEAGSRAPGSRADKDRARVRGPHLTPPGCRREPSGCDCA